MGNLDKYDSTSERVDYASAAEKYNKYCRIAEFLDKEGIEIIDVGHIIMLEDKSCGFKMGHNVMTWDIFRAVDVADMIVSARDKYKEIKK